MNKFPTYGYKPSTIAHWFLNATDREAGDSITHLKLQKLLYYAQAWSLALDGKSLFEEELEAWTHGPVVRSVYNEFKQCGYDAIPLELTKESNIDNEDVLCILNQVNEVYGSSSAKFLEKKTHSELPWQEARGDLPIELKSQKKISKKTMRDFYKSKLDGTQND